MTNYFHRGVSMTPKRGDLLISEPFLPDPNFERTVVLICENNEDGSIGFILNKPSLVNLDDVFEELGNFKKKLLVGGPVQQDSMHFIHRSLTNVDGGTKIGDGIYWGGNFEQLKILMKENRVDPGDVLYFLGYSGWAPGQLDEELRENSWIVSPDATAAQVFDLDPELLWQEVLKNMGGKYRMFSNYPTDPRLN
jgi:putative transcriptional regulator